MALRWLHLSDLHFGAGDASTAANRQIVLHRLEQDIQQMVSRLGRPDFIFVTGDIAQSGQAEHYQLAQTWLSGLATLLGAAVYVVPGNHDVDRAAINADRNRLRLHRGLQSGDDQLDNILAAPVDRALLSAKLQNFLNFAQNNYGWVSSALWQQVELRPKVTLLGLNTALLSGDGDSPKSLQIGQQQLNDVVQAPGLVVVLGHHPPEWLRDGDQLLGFLGNRAHLAFFGHVHQAGGGVNLGFGGQHLSLRAAAAHAPLGHDGYGYAWGELGPPGLVYYPRQWSARRGSFIADNHQGDLDTREGLTLGLGQLPRALQGWLSAGVAAPVRLPESEVISVLSVPAQKVSGARTLEKTGTTLRDELVEHIRQNRALWVAGTGVALSASGGAPLAGWAGLIKNGLEYAAELHQRSPQWLAAQLNLLEHAADAEDLITLATQVEQRLRGGEWAGWLRKTVGSLQVQHPEVIQIFHRLGQGRLSTCNYDDLMTSGDYRPVAWDRPDKVIRILNGQDKGVIHWHGHWDSPASVVLGYQKYTQVIKNDAAQSLQAAVAALGSLVFVGFGGGLSDPNFGGLLDWMAAALADKQDHHFWLVRDDEKEDLKPLIPQLNRQRVVVVAYGAQYSDLAPYLKQLAQDAGLGAPSAKIVTEQGEPLPVQAQKLREARTEARRKNLPTAELDQKLSQLHRRMRKEKVLRPGDRVRPDFTVVREIGRGGFAVVYEVVDSAQNIHALKVLHGEHAHDASRVARFEKGAGEMARLSHPGIVKITHPYSTDGEFHYFGMTYLPGGNLEEGVLAKKIGVDAGLKLLAQVCEAVAYAHDAGVVHRDIKPSNILLDAAGQPQLTDFDLVKVEGSSAGTRGALGTFIYAAPEVMDDVEVDARADIFSLGMCAAFVLHQQKISHGDFMNLGRFVEGLGARWLISAIEAKPPDRLPNAGALCKLLLGRHRNAPWADDEDEDQFGAWASFGLGSVTVRMRWIPPGQFLMGSPKTEAGRSGPDDHKYHEGPQHTVVFTKGFWLAEYPCTQVLWEAVMGRNPSRFRSPTRPVERVSWDDVQKFLAATEKLRPGLKLGLPTEAQWEYACRAGTRTATYAGNLEILGENNAPLLDKIAWYGGNCGVEFDLGEGVKASEWPEKQYEFSRGGTRPVGLKLANPWGLYDMLGNVWEWCADGLRKYEPGTFTSARGPEGPSWGARVVRGGSWRYHVRIQRAAYRLDFRPDEVAELLGFRLFRGQ